MKVFKFSVVFSILFFSSIFSTGLKAQLLPDYIPVGINSSSNTVQSSVLDFRVNPKILDNGKIIFSNEYFKNGLDFVSSGHDFNDFDLLGLKKFGRQQILLAKSAFIVKRPVGDFTENKLISEAFLKKLIPGIKQARQDPTNKNRFFITKETKTFLSKLEIKFTGEADYVKKSDIAKSQWATLISSRFDSGHGVPEITLEQRAINFNKALNGVSQSIRYYSLGSDQTLIIINQLISVDYDFAKKIDRIPFVNFESLFKEETQDTVEIFAEGMKNI